MSRKSSATHYGSIAITIHWLSALLIIALMASGIRSDNFSDPAQKAGVLSVHAPLGITVLLLTLFRLYWWWRKDTKPKPVAGMPGWQEKSSTAVHVLVYVVIFLMVASGIGTFALSGAGPIIFGGAPGPLPDFSIYPPRSAHGIGAKVMIALFVFHVGAALYHQFITKDGLIWRMWYSKDK